MEKRALLAVVLSIAVFYVFSTYIMPPPPKQPATAVQQKATSSALAQQSAVPTDADCRIFFRSGFTSGHSGRSSGQGDQG